GMGISERNQEQIFKKYERINHDVEGQGIGLFLAKKIVDATGGDIKVESELGQGSTFIIYFKAESPSLN
ncbi:sensor histidine kinase, partial [Pontibacter toksunensis]